MSPSPVEAYPLQWPLGRPRTQQPQRSRFDSGLAEARDGLLDEIRLLGGAGPVISTNVPTRRDGLPYANARTPDDRGVAVYFELRGRPMCFACDRWDSVGDNIQAIRKTIEALRGIQRWGSGDMVGQAFSGFQALPSPEERRPAHEVLDVHPLATEVEIDAAYRAKAKSAHPDAGGSEAAMRELAEARRIMKAVGNRGLRWEVDPDDRR
ncbi:MAG: hypothetical protein BGO49_11280 [Planctomycetales bacterium 71-10]|nr:MAG: hypothetical protein BGO49_11280 [Planctomycetales bacterium 71-10]